MTEQARRSQITVRPATAVDEEAVLALMEQLFAAPGARSPYYTVERGRAGLRWAVHGQNADILLAVDAGRIVGLASVYADILSVRYGPRCWLQDLVVDPARRSGGIGRALLDAATEWAREHGCTHLELGSGSGRVDAHRFYLREGMKQGYTFTREIG